MCLHLPACAHHLPYNPNPPPITLPQLVLTVVCFAVFFFFLLSMRLNFILAKISIQRERQINPIYPNKHLVVGFA